MFRRNILKNVLDISPPTTLKNLGLNKPKLKELIDFQRRPVHYL